MLAYLYELLVACYSISRDSMSAGESSSYFFEESVDISICIYKKTHLISISSTESYLLCMFGEILHKPVSSHIFGGFEESIKIEVYNTLFIHKSFCLSGKFANCSVVKLCCRVFIPDIYYLPIK